MRTTTIWPSVLSLALAITATSCTKEDPVTPDQPDGSVAFWSRVGDEGNITVAVDGTIVGVLDSHFPLGTPSPHCNDQGTLTVSLEPGEHECRATSTAGSTWAFKFVVFSNQCDTDELLDD